MNSFLLALKFTLPAEGGDSDNPNDHGGPTNFGVTQTAWNAYCEKHGLPWSGVSGITLADARAVYQEFYWKAGHCDQLPEKLGVCHFDWCINHGVEGAARTLQAALGVAQDGDIGPITLAAAAKCDVWPIVRKYLALRRAWYIKDADNNPSQREFLAGWLRREDKLQTYLGTLGAA